MTREQAQQGFVDVILAEPDVKDHRLIYADWLEENGDLHKAEGLRTLPELAGVWSSDWGEDQYGLWCVLMLKGVRQNMRWIPPGAFFMGSPQDERGRYDDEGPVQQVEITRGFWFADTLCTQEMWQAVLRENPSAISGKRHPVESVSWIDCQEFLTKAQHEKPGVTLSLPTEAQWEYACRVGTAGSRYHKNLNSIAWTSANSDGGAHPVGEKAPNDFGLYDMLGNVWEWCHDGIRHYGTELVKDPMGEDDKDSRRAIRGSSWNFHQGSARAAYRLFLTKDSRGYDLGLRLLSST